MNKSFKIIKPELFDKIKYRLAHEIFNNIVKYANDLNDQGYVGDRMSIFQDYIKEDTWGKIEKKYLDLNLSLVDTKSFEEYNDAESIFDWIRGRYDEQNIDGMAKYADLFLWIVEN